MTLLGRHKLPQNEGCARAEGKHFADAMIARASLSLCVSVFVMTSVSQTASAQLQNETSFQSLGAAVAVDLLPSSQTVIQNDAFKLQIPETNSTRLLDLNLDFDNVGCLGGEQNCLLEEAPVDVVFSRSLASNSKKGLDVELVPSASVRFNDESRSAVVGAVVRIGEDLRNKEVSSNTWYVFAGADAEALSYSPESATALTRGEFGLSERIIIGDAQAGIGYRIGSADVSIGYFRREISTFDTPGAEGFSKVEDAAALSFTWKR